MLPTKRLYLYVWTGAGDVKVEEIEKMESLKTSISHVYTKDP